MPEKEIAFEDIRIGDRIRLVQEFENGYVLTREGRAEKNDGITWFMNSGALVASKRTGNATKQYHILVEREEVKDHIVVSTRVISRDVEVVVRTLISEEEAGKVVEKLTERHRGDAGDRKIFRAVKVS